MTWGHRVPLDNDTLTSASPVTAYWMRVCVCARDSRLRRSRCPIVQRVFSAPCLVICNLPIIVSTQCTKRTWYDDFILKLIGTFECVRLRRPLTRHTLQQCRLIRHSFRALFDCIYLKWGALFASLERSTCFARVFFSQNSLKFINSHTLHGTWAHFDLHSFSFWWSHIFGARSRCSRAGFDKLPHNIKSIHIFCNRNGWPLAAIKSIGRYTQRELLNSYG